jgi:hypothetical protein
MHRWEEVVNGIFPVLAGTYEGFKHLARVSALAALFMLTHRTTPMT